MRIRTGRDSGQRRFPSQRRIGVQFGPELLAVVVLTILVVSTSTSAVTAPPSTRATEIDTAYSVSEHVSDPSSRSPLTTASAAPSPFPMSGAAVVYDVADGYDVLFGGFSNGTLSSSTWTFADGAWTNISATAGTPPSARSGMSMTYDSADGYVLAYGGVVDSNECDGSFGDNCNDTWEFHAGHWTQLFPIVRPICYEKDPTVCSDLPSGSNPITYDSVTGSVVLFDGYTFNSQYDTATWSYSSDVWTQLNLTPAQSPPGQSSEEMAFDPALGAIVLFGGATEGSRALIQNTTWFFEGGIWTNHTSESANSPTPRTSFGLTYDSTSDQLILFGGDWAVCRTFNDIGECTSYLGGASNDTWTFGSAGWSNVTGGLAPAARAGLALADYPGGGGVLLFGGYSNATTGEGFLGDTWSWLGPSKGWSLINGPAPLAVPVVSANPNPAVFGKPVQFTSSESGGYLPYTYSWAFGDGGTGGNLANITHAFTTNGPFQVVLTVVDAARDTTVGRVSVSILLQAQINDTNSSGATPLHVDFMASAVGGTPPYSFSWNFGDGTNLSDQTVTTHTFNRSGSYTVTLTVTDGMHHQSSAQVQVCAGSCQSTGFLGLPGDYGYILVGAAVAALVAILAGVLVSGRASATDRVETGFPSGGPSSAVDDEPVEMLQPGEVDPAEDLV